MRKPTATLASTLLAVGFLFLLAVPASAQYVTGPETCGVDDVTIVPGQTITVTGSGYPANSVVTVTIGGIELGTVTTDDSGNFSKTFQVPDSVAPGTYSIGCTDVEGKTIGNDVSVVGGAVGGTAFTGTSLNVPLWTVLAAALLATGVALVALGGRRGRAGAHRA